MLAVKKSYDLALVGLVLIITGFAVLIAQSFSPTGFVVIEPVASTFSSSALLLGLASLVVATQRLKNHALLSPESIAYYLSITRKRNEIQKLLSKCETHKAAAALGNVLFRGIIEKDTAKMNLFGDVEDILAEKKKKRKIHRF